MKPKPGKNRRKGREKERPQSSAAHRRVPAPSAHETSSTPQGRFPIVGVGASAGGLEAFSELLKHLPTNTGMAFVLVQHLAPAHESELTQLLSRKTRMPTHEVTNNLAVKPNHVYVIPPNTRLSIRNGVLKLSSRDQGLSGVRSIDSFFESLAEDQRECAIGIILSGTATDGTLGMEAIKAEGGFTFAQDHTAKYDSMPRSAAAAGCVDLVLSPAEIARELAEIAKHPYAMGASLARTEVERASAVASEDKPGLLPSGGRGSPRVGGRQAHAEASEKSAAHDERFKAILILLRNHSGVDFSLYESNTIQRRITRRIVLNKMSSPEEYATFLKRNARELDALYSDVLIGVTSFFRNPEAFEVLQHNILPGILKSRPDDPLRVWVLGCSTGQETYSLAMILDESLEKLPRKPKVQIFATDLNEALLDKARNGLYAKTLVQDVSPERLRRFFVEEDGGYRISKTMRESVIFARQNFLNDPPFSRMDLISCRNVLIYLDGAAQKKVIPTFHYALKPEGVLFLDASESIGVHAELFDPVDRKHKIYKKKPAPTPMLDVHFSPRHPGEKKEIPAARPAHRPEGLHTEINIQREADRVALNRYVPPSVLVNAGWQVMHFRGDTSQYLKPPSGRPTFHLFQMAREGLAVPLRSALNKASRENRIVRKENVRIGQNGDAGPVNIEIVPLKNLRERCFLVFFEDPSQHPLLQPPVELPAQETRKDASPASGSKMRQHIAVLNRELTETRDYLQSIQEQYEAANEELQASNEEVTSANEELQSINEELETSKEELESANEELTTVNEEMANRNLELGRLNSDLVNLVANVNMAIVLLANDLTVRRFTPPAEKLFNLLATDVGRPFDRVRHNLELPALGQMLAEAIDSVSVRECEARGADGKWYSVRIRPYLTLDKKIDGAVLAVMDIDALKRGEQEIKAARDYAQATLRTIPTPLLVLRPDLRVEFANEVFYREFHTSLERTEGIPIYQLGNGQWNIPKLRQFLEEIIPRNSFFKDFEVVHDFPVIGRRTMSLNARRLEGDSGLPQRILLAIVDLTDRIEAEAAVRQSEVRFRRLFETARDGILLVNPVTRKITDSNAFMSELTGRGRKRFHGQELWQVGLLPDEAASYTAFRVLQEKGELRLHAMPLKTGSGGELFVEMVANRYIEDGSEIIQCNIRDVTERNRAEQQLRKAKEDLERANNSLDQRVQERTAALEQMNARLQELSSQILNAQEEERQRISRELHDEIGQSLTGMNLLLQRLAASTPSAELKDLQETVATIMQQVREMSFDLHPHVLDDLGLKAALDAYFKTYRERANIEVHFDYRGFPESKVGPNVPITIFRIIQEALTNVVRHSESRDVTMNLFADDQKVHLEVHDSGKGIDNTDDRLHFSSGLSGMRERAMLIGGTLRIESKPGEGTHLFLSFPVENDNDLG